MTPRAQDHAFPVDHDAVRFRGGGRSGIEISAAWTRNVYLLSGRLSKTRSAGSEEVKVRGVPAALLARADEGGRISHYFAAVRESACGTKRTSRHAQPMSAFGGKADIVLRRSNVCF